MAETPSKRVPHLRLAQIAPPVPTFARGAHDDARDDDAVLRVVRRGASLAWATHTPHADCRCASWSQPAQGTEHAPVVFVVRDTGRTFGVRPHDGAREYRATLQRDATPDACAQCRAADCADTCSHMAGGARPVRSRYFDPWDGTRDATGRTMAAWRATDPTAVVIARRMRDAVLEGYAPHRCPTVKGANRMGGVTRSNTRHDDARRTNDVPDVRVRAMMARASRMTTPDERAQNARERAALTRERAARIARRERAWRKRHAS